MTNDELMTKHELQSLALGGPSDFGFRHSDFLRLSSFGFLSFNSSFDVTNWRESHDWLADSRQFSRCDYFIDVFVSWTCFLGETRPRGAADVNPARFEF